MAETKSNICDVTDMVVESGVSDCRPLVEDSDKSTENSYGQSSPMQNVGSSIGAPSASGGDATLESKVDYDTKDEATLSMSESETVVHVDFPTVGGVTTSGLCLQNPSVHHPDGGDSDAHAEGSAMFVGYGFKLGDMVWGKVKSHPWWPGFIFNEAFASPNVLRTKKDGHVLVAFFGDNSYGWFDPAELIPYEPHFSEKSHQTTSRAFVKAVEESVDEASRRSALGLTCRCRNPYNFRASSVPGYLAVDVPDYEPGALYTSEQVANARQNFHPIEALSFLKQLAVAPSANQTNRLDFSKKKSAALAYRDATFEEFDETYAQAFGQTPVRPARLPPSDSDQSARALLSGPMVIAESLNARKSSTKLPKSREQSKKNKYLFKRRDEPGDLRYPQSAQGQASSFAHSAYEDCQLDSLPAEYAFQRRDQYDDGAGSSQGSEKGASKLGTEAKLNPELDNSREGSPSVQESDSTGKIVKVKLDGSRKGGASEKSLGRPDSEKSEPREKKKKKQKKGTDSEGVSSHRPQKKKHSLLGNGGATGSLPAQISSPSPQSSYHQKNETLSEQVAEIGPFLPGAGKNVGELLQYMDDLRMLALDPTHGKERNGPALARQFFLRFRGLVFQKSLGSSPPSSSEAEPVDVKPIRPTPGAASSSHTPGESIRGFPPSSQNQKPMGRSDEPSKGGKKRVQSERQEEITAKRAKKITVVKSASSEKRKGSEGLRPDGKSKLAALSPLKNGGSRVAESMAKAPSPPHRRMEDPTFLVMKYPSGRIPSPAELKARWARFGPMDMTQMRVYYSTGTCRVCFIYREDAEKALRFAQGNKSLFPNVRFSLKSVMGVPSSDHGQSEQLRRGGGKEEGHTLDAPEPRPSMQLSTLPTSAQVQLKSCLKKPGVGDESAGQSGGGRGVARVRFNMGSGGGVGSSAASGEVGGPLSTLSSGPSSLSSLSSSSFSVPIDVISDNNQQQKMFSSAHPLLPPPPLPLPFPYPQLSRAGGGATQGEGSNNENSSNHRFSVGATNMMQPPPQLHQVDISQQMLRLLTRCNDVVTNVKSLLGYVPYHPL